MAPLLELESVCKSFEGSPVLRKVSFSINERETVCILGPSGSGKTTLLRCISLLEYIDAGAIRYKGQCVIEGQVSASRRFLWQKYPDHRVHVSEHIHRTRFGFVFQSYNLFPNKTVLENLIEGPIYVKHMSRDESIADARRLLERVGILGKENSYPNELSGGEQQRVALARVLCMKPEVLLLDEITAALDPARASEILDLVQEISNEHRMAILMITHQLDFVSRTADKVLFMHYGELVEQGTTDELFKSQLDVVKRFLARPDDVLPEKRHGNADKNAIISQETLFPPIG